VKICPVWENPGQNCWLWQRKPWLPERTDLVPKALGMTNFPRPLRHPLLPMFRPRHLSSAYCPLNYKPISPLPALLATSASRKVKRNISNNATRSVKPRMPQSGMRRRSRRRIYFGKGRQILAFPTPPLTRMSS